MSGKKEAPLCGIMDGMASQRQIKVSERAYTTLKAMASEDEKFKGRGVTGVIDDMLFGVFTTNGSGRPFGSKNSKKSNKKS